VLAALTYSYDNVGNRSSCVEQNGDRVTWSYDTTYQLTREQRSGANAYDITYSYDATQNRLTKLQSAITATYSYDAANELLTEATSSQTITYSYDSQGHLDEKDEAGQLTTMTWNGAGQMTGLVLPSGALLTMTYDGSGFRRSLQDSSGTTKFLNDRVTGTPGLDPVLVELNASNNTVVVYTPGISLRRSSATKYYHADALGSVRLLSDAAQVISDSYLYEAFGKLVASSGSTTNPLRFGAQDSFFTDGQSGLTHTDAGAWDAGVAQFMNGPSARGAGKGGLDAGAAGALNAAKKGQSWDHFEHGAIGGGISIFDDISFPKEGGINIGIHRGEIPRTEGKIGWLDRVFQADFTHSAVLDAQGNVIKYIEPHFHFGIPAAEKDMFGRKWRQWPPLLHGENPDITIPIRHRPKWKTWPKGGFKLLGAAGTVLTIAEMGHAVSNNDWNEVGSIGAGVVGSLAGGTIGTLLCGPLCGIAGGFVGGLIGEAAYNGISNLFKCRR